MRNNRAQFFGLYLVALTLVMCGVVVGLFYVQQGNALNSLVSPRVVLDVRDNLDIFEMREMDLINESLVEANKSFEFCSDGFAEKFGEVFVEGVLRDEGMREFIFDSLIFEGVDVEDSARLESTNFFENILYSEGLSDCDGNSRGFSRASVGKSFRLKASDESKVNFPVDFSFEFGRDYLISEVDGEFEVAKV